MLNKNEFAEYTQALLSRCTVTRRTDSVDDAATYSTGDDVALTEAVFSSKESYLLFKKGGIEIGSLTVSVPTTDDGVLSEHAHSSRFVCSEPNMPIMRHFAKSADKHQENRAAMTKYLEKLLQDYSVSLGDNANAELACYDRKGNHVELAENLFKHQVSQLAIKKDGEQLGVIHFAGEYNDKRAWVEGEPYDFLDVYAFSNNNCRELLPQMLILVA